MSMVSTKSELVSCSDIKQRRELLGGPKQRAQSRVRLLFMLLRCALVLLSIFGRLVVLSACVGYVAGFRLTGVSTNTGTGLPTTLPFEPGAPDNIFTFSNGLTVYGAMSMNQGSSGMPDFFLFDLQGNRLASAITDEKKKNNLEFMNPMKVFYSNENCHSSRLTLQESAGTYTLVFDQKDQQNGDLKKMWASCTDGVTSYVYGGGEGAWNKIYRFDMLQPFFTNVAYYTQTNLNKVRTMVLFNSNYIAVAGAFSYKHLIERTALTNFRSFSSPTTQIVHSLMNNLENKNWYTDGSDDYLYDYNLVASTGSSLQLNNPRIGTGNTDFVGFFNVATLQYLGVGEYNNNKLYIISKVSFTIYSTLLFADQKKSTASIRGVLTLGNKHYFGRIEQTNLNFQSYYLEFGNCTARSISSVCTSCISGYSFIFAFESTGDCILAQHSPDRYGLDTTTNRIEQCADFTRCLRCALNKNMCTLCDFRNGYFVLGGSCFTVGTVQSGFGVDQESKSFRTCSQQSRCDKCASNYLACTDCKKSNGFYLYSMTHQCLTVDEAPTGVGLDLVGLEFGSCLQGSRCLVCRSDRSKCTVCNTQAGYYLFESTCITEQEAPEGTGIDLTQGIIRPCLQSLRCKSCSSGYQVCSTCDESVGLYKYKQTECMLIEEAPTGIGLDKNTKQFTTCQERTCDECKQDILVCTRCLDSRTHYLDNGKCLAIPNCDLIFTSNSYSNSTQKASYKFSNKRGLFDAYNMTVQLMNGAGENIAHARSQDFVIEILNGAIEIETKYQGDVLDGSLLLQLVISPTALCHRFTRDKNVTLIVKHISVKRSLIDLGRKIEAAGAALAVTSQVVPYTMLSLNPSVANLLNKVLAGFYWMKLLNGPQLLYPSLVFTLIDQNKNSIIMANPFNQKKLQERFRNGYADCEPYENFARRNITCAQIEHEEPNLIFTGTVFLVNLAVSVSFGLFRSLVVRPREHGEHSLHVKREMKSLRYILFDIFHKTFGARFFVNSFMSNSFKALSYCLVELSFSGRSPKRILGVLCSILYIAILISILIWTVLFLLRNKASIRTAIEERKEVEQIEKKINSARLKNRTQQANQAAETDKDSPTDQKRKLKNPEKSMCSVLHDVNTEAWAPVSYLFESRNLSWNMLLVFEPVVDISRVFVLSLTILATAKTGVFQVLLIVLLEIAYLTFIVFANSRTDKIESYVDILTSFFGIVYCLLNVGANFQMDVTVKEYKLGLAMAVMLLLILSINILYIIFSICYHLCYRQIVLIIRKRKQLKIEIARSSLISPNKSSPAKSVPIQRENKSGGCQNHSNKLRASIKEPKTATPGMEQISRVKNLKPKRVLLSSETPRLNHPSAGAKNNRLIAVHKSEIRPGILNSPHLMNH